MSALAKMMVDMVLKEIPEETRGLLMQALSPESLDKFGNALGSLMSFIQEDLPRLKEDIQLIKGALERMENDNGSSDGTCSRNGECGDCGEFHDGDCPI